jgi:hypothetical protein
VGNGVFEGVGQVPREGSLSHLPGAKEPDHREGRKQLANLPGMGVALYSWDPIVPRKFGFKDRNVRVGKISSCAPGERRR